MGTVPSHARLCARFLDETVGSYLQSRAASYSTNEPKLALWYDTAYGFRTILADIQRGDTTLRSGVNIVEAHLLLEDPTGFTLIASSIQQLKEDAVNHLIRKKRESLDEWYKKGLDPSPFYFAYFGTDNVLADAVLHKQLQETSRIMPYQVAEYVTAGAEMAQRLYMFLTIQK